MKRFLLLAITLALTLAACQSPAPATTPGPDVPAGTVALIDGQAVSDQQWQQARAYALVTLRLLGQPGAQLDEEAVLRSYLEDRVIEQEAAQQGFRVSAERIDAEQRRLLQVAGKNEDDLAQLLGEIGLQPQQWRQELARSVLAGQYVDEVVLAGVEPARRAQTREEWLAQIWEEYQVSVVAAPPPIEGAGVGNIAPDFSLPTLAGQTLRLADLRGQVVLVNFWATWCGPCREELPLLMQSYEQHRAEDFVVVGVNVGEREEQVRDFAQEMGIDFPIVLDADQNVSRKYRVFGLPTSLLLNRQGVIDYVFVGALHDPSWSQTLNETLSAND